MNLEWKFRVMHRVMLMTGYRRFSESTVAAARARDDKPVSPIEAMIFGSLIDLPHVEDIEIEVRHGRIPARLYRPTLDENRPMLIFLHGGGFTVGSLNRYDRVCRRLARDAGRVVVSVDYRLAPEHPFPAGLEDSYDATRWVIDHAAELGGIPDDCAIGGDSAGANLSTVICHMLRDEEHPLIGKQLLIYPPVNSSVDYPSEVRFADAPILSKSDIDYFTNYYLNGPEDRLDPKVSPILGNLEDLPPTFLVNAEYDPLVDHGRLYAEALRAAGNQVIHKVYPRQVHGFINIPNVQNQAFTAYADMALFLKTPFEKAAAAI